MTVASLMFATSFPIAFTDHLVSNEKGSPTPPVTPVSGLETRIGSTGDIPVGLGLKLWESPANIYLMYAGNIEDARKILDMVELAIQQEDYSRDINQRIKCAIKQAGLAASFIIVYLSPRGRVSFCASEQAKHYLGSQFRRVVMIGSGKEPLVRMINKVSGYLKSPLPSIKKAPLEHIGRAINNALSVVAQSTRDYMKGDRSLFAAHSTGGVFTISYFLGLYWLDEQPPAYLENSLCQIFTECEGEQVYLTRLIITRRQHKSQHMDVYVFEGKHPLVLGEKVLELPLQQFSHTQIANFRRHSSIGPMSPLSEDFPLFQVITYATAQVTGGRLETQNVDFNGELAITLSNGKNTLRLEQHRDIVAKLWKRCGKHDDLG